MSKRKYRKPLIQSSVVIKGGLFRPAGYLSGAVEKPIKEDKD